MSSGGAASSRIGILFALPEEAAPLRRDLLQNPELQKKFEVAISGVGAKNAEAAARKLLETPNRSFRLLVMAGFGGGLSPDLKPGSLVVAKRVEYFGSHPLWEKSFAASQTLLDRFSRRLTAPDMLPRFQFGNFATTDRVLVTHTEKQDFFNAHACPVVEMETAGAISVAEAKGIPWLAVRVITDTADEDLPLDFNALADANGSPDRRKIIREVLRKPGAIPGLIRLGGRSGSGAKQLREFLIGVCAGL